LYTHYTALSDGSHVTGVRQVEKWCCVVLIWYFINKAVILTLFVLKSNVWSCRGYGRISPKFGLVAQSNSEGWRVSLPRCRWAGEV